MGIDRRTKDSKSYTPLRHLAADIELMWKAVNELGMGYHPAARYMLETHSLKVSHTVVERWASKKLEDLPTDDLVPGTAEPMPRAKKIRVLPPERGPGLADDIEAEMGIEDPRIIFAVWLSLPRQLRKPPTMTEFSRRTGVSMSLLNTWKKSDVFQEFVEERAEKMIEDTLRGYRLRIHKLVDVLWEDATNNKSVQSARYLLDTFFGMTPGLVIKGDREEDRELTDILEMLAERMANEEEK